MTWAASPARYPAQRAIRPLVSAGPRRRAAVVGSSAAGGPGGRRQRWPLPQTTTVPATVATSYAVTVVGTGLTRGYVFTRSALESYFGPGPTKRLVARLANAGMWAGAATAAYNAGVTYIGRANEKVEPGYATPPGTPLVSGSEQSLLPFADLGQQGRRYVTDVVTPELIKEVMGEDAVADRSAPTWGSTASRSTRPGGPSWPWPSWPAPAPSTGRNCCWCRRPAPAGSTTP